MRLSQIVILFFFLFTVAGAIPAHDNMRRGLVARDQSDPRHVIYKDLEETHPSYERIRQLLDQIGSLTTRITDARQKLERDPSERTRARISIQIRVWQRQLARAQQSLRRHTINDK